MTIDITRSPPPIAERPKCAGCSKPLRPYMDTTWGRYETIGGGHAQRLVSKAWSGGYHCYGAFCTQTCAVSYANYMFKKHGTRLVLETS